MRLLLIVPVALLIFAFFVLQQTSLSSVEKLIAKQFPVDAISHRQLKQALDSDSTGQFILFDVRQRDEYEISHLKNAIQLDPELKVEAFFNLHGSHIKGKKVVFYCSVGYRSSSFIEQIEKQARSFGIISAQNLTGGIFRWYKERLPVFDRSGQTDQVHPYDAFWGKLLIDNENKMDPK